MNEEQRSMQPSATPGNGTAPPRFRVGDLEVDLGKAEVTRGEEKIALPKLSFDLLCALINAAPAIVTNDELLEQVWPGLQVSPESVAQRVKLLRSAIGDDSQQPRYILGVRGRGYRLIPAVERLTESRQLTRDATSPSIDTASPTIADKSIAVLPFVDMSEKGDQEYFADGMAEEIITLLVKIPGLKVIARTSSFQFKGQTEDLRTIATKLGVTYVLQGSVRKSGNRLRVTAQLINSKDGTHLWSQTYDRDLSDVFKMQDEIAMAVVRALQVEVIGFVIASRPALRNTEAYTHYLQGFHSFGRFDQQGLEQALGDFQRSLELDASFAPAAHMLGASYALLGSWGFMAPTLALGRALDAQEHALKLDPTLAIAHAVLGLVYCADWDWPAADRAFEQALALGPRDAVVLFLAADEYRIMGRWDEALKLVNRSLVLDPLSPYGNFVLARIQVRRGRLQEAEDAARRALASGPAFAFAHSYLSEVLLARGEAEPALTAMLHEEDGARRLGGSAMAHFAIGRRSESDAALAQLKRDHSDQSPFHIARVCAFRGELDEAFNWLERAYAQKDINLQYIVSEPAVKSLVGDARYKALLKKMNWPE